MLDGVLCNEGMESEAAALGLEIAQNAQACAARLTHVYYHRKSEELREQRFAALKPKDGA